MKTCYIFGAAEGLPVALEKQNGDIIIAADAGYLILERMGIKPDIILGDFDSLGQIPKSDCEIIKHPVKKNDTDTMLAVKTGFARGFNRFVLYGCTGKRLDHTLANIQALNYISKNGGQGYICGEDFAVTVITNQKIRFFPKKSGNVSIFSMTERSENIDIKGLMYTLSNAEISSDFPLGVSNEFIGEFSEISVGKGSMAVIWSGSISDVAEI